MAMRAMSSRPRPYNGTDLFREREWKERPRQRDHDDDDDGSASVVWAISGLVGLVVLCVIGAVLLFLVRYKIRRRQQGESRTEAQVTTASRSGQEDYVRHDIHCIQSNTSLSTRAGKQETFSSKYENRDLSAQPAVVLGQFEVLIPTQGCEKLLNCTGQWRTLTSACGQCEGAMKDTCGSSNMSRSERGCTLEACISNEKGTQDILCRTQIVVYDAASTPKLAGALPKSKQTLVPQEQGDDASIKVMDVPSKANPDGVATSVASESDSVAPERNLCVCPGGQVTGPISENFLISSGSCLGEADIDCQITELASASENESVSSCFQDRISRLGHSC